MIVWKEIKEFPNYRISNNGVCVNSKGHEMSKRMLPNGYVQYMLSKDGKKYMRYAHRLVADAFINNPNNLPQVNHKDENKANNDVSNLEWCTNKYNINYGSAKERISNSLMERDCGVHVICIETGIEYPSIRQCAKEMGLYASELGRLISGKRNLNTVHGYHFVKAKGIRA